MFVLNRVIDFIFLFDMVLQFFLAYEINDRNVFEFDPRKVAINYLSGWFAIDLVAVGVSVLDILALDRSLSGSGSGRVEQGAWRLEIVRAVRALRLIKMVRLVKVRRNHLLQAVRGKVARTHSWEMSYAINYNLVRMGHVVLLLCAATCQPLARIRGHAPDGHRPAARSRAAPTPRADAASP